MLVTGEDVSKMQLFYQFSMIYKYTELDISLTIQKHLKQLFTHFIIITVDFPLGACNIFW